MVAKDNGIGWAAARLAIHAEVMKLVQLLGFAVVPEVPGREFAASKGTKGFFLGGDRRGLESLDGEGKVIDREVVNREVEVRVAKGGDGTEGSGGECRRVIVINLVGGKEIEWGRLFA